MFRRFCWNRGGTIARLSSFRAILSGNTNHSSSQTRNNSSEAASAALNKSTHVLKSKYEDVTIPNISLSEYLYNKQEECANLVGLINGETGQSFKHSEIRENCLKVGSGLSRLGFNIGEKLAILSPNCPEFVFAFVGAITIGLVPTTINFSYTADEIRFQLQNSEASSIVCHSEKLDVVKEAVKGNDNIRHIITIGNGDENTISISKILKDDGKGIPNQVQINPKEDLAAIPYSSGTTGLPKGVMLTHYNLISNLQQITPIEICHFDHASSEDSQETTVGVLPMYHIYGMVINVFLPFTIGATVITLKEFQQNQFVETIRRFRPSALPLVPPLVQFLENSELVAPSDLNSVTKIMSGAAPLGRSAIEKFQKKFGDKIFFSEGYGMTESSPVTHLTPKSGIVIGSCGQAIPNTEVKLVDPMTGEAIPPFAGKGELCVRGPQVMKGYLKNEKATLSTVKDGWLHTGDIARIDEKGLVYIVDRLKELIKVKGLQVAPAELEDLLRKHPLVKDVAVIGIPDERAGEIPKAFIVPYEGKKQLTEDEVKSFVAAKVSSHKHIQRVAFTDSIPKSAAGKILRKELRNLP